MVTRTLSSSLPLCRPRLTCKRAEIPVLCSHDQTAVTNSAAMNSGTNRVHLFCYWLARSSRPTKREGGGHCVTMGMPTLSCSLGPLVSCVCTGTYVRVLVRVRFRTKIDQLNQPPHVIVSIQSASSRHEIPVIET